MVLETSLLLRDIEIEGKLFKTHKYIILSFNNFPYFFLTHLKKIILNRYVIARWISISNVDEFHSYQDLGNNLFYYEENKTITQYYENFGYICHIQDRTDIKKIPLLLDKIDQGNDYYIFLIDEVNIFLLKKYLYYDLSMIFNENKKFILQNYIKNFLTIEFDLFLNYFFNHHYDAIQEYMTIEIFFHLLAYLPNIKKNNIADFIHDYVLYIGDIQISMSLFDLSTLFFQKNKISFFSVWNMLFKKYSVDFWLYFWQEQLWYCQLFLISDSAEDMWWIKKINRWFLRYGKENYISEDLLQASLDLYKLDGLHKKYQTDLLLDLNSFFILWFN